MKFLIVFSKHNEHVSTIGTSSKISEARRYIDKLLMYMDYFHESGPWLDIKQIYVQIGL